LKINPKFIRAYIKALIYLKLKHYQEALNCIEEGLDIEETKLLFYLRWVFITRLGNKSRLYLMLEIDPKKSY
jgi:hypothetical protein